MSKKKQNPKTNTTKDKAKKIPIEEVKEILPLEILAKNGLLFYEGGRLGNKSQADSIKDFNTSYNTLSPLAKEFTNICAARLTESKRTATSFEGLVFRKFPVMEPVKEGKKVTGYDRIDCYTIATQRIHLCTDKSVTYKGNIYTTPADPVTILTHEATHAIDDNFTANKSARKLSKYFAGSDYSDKETETILHTAALILDPTEALVKDYIKPFLANAKQDIKALYEGVKEFENPQNYKDVFNANLDYGKSEKLAANREPYNSKLLEYTSFHTEKLFDILKKETTKTIFDNLNVIDAPQQFIENYKKSIETVLRDCNIEQQKLIKPALEIIKLTSQDFLNIITEFPKDKLVNNQSTEITITECSTDLKTILKEIVPTIEKIQLEYITTAISPPHKSSSLPPLSSKKSSATTKGADIEEKETKLLLKTERSSKESSSSDEEIRKPKIKKPKIEVEEEAKNLRETIKDLITLKPNSTESGNLTPPSTPTQPNTTEQRKR